MEIIKLMQYLGYHPNINGMCAGIANTSVQSFHRQDLNTFIDRMALIHRSGHFENLIISNEQIIMSSGFDFDNKEKVQPVNEIIQAHKVAIQKLKQQLFDLRGKLTQEEKESMAQSIQTSQETITRLTNAKSKSFTKAITKLKQKVIQTNEVKKINDGIINFLLENHVNRIDAINRLRIIIDSKIEYYSDELKTTSPEQQNILEIQLMRYILKKSMQLKLKLLYKQLQMLRPTMKIPNH
ncbi:hypothetical protein L3V83_07380 [Thiotrichales bacterium 19X7-9]|nr:hypothetical protein [Thiotrichales bacterium 19X7-9]